MIGYLYLSGMTIDAAEKYLEKKYAEYYKEPYVRVKYMNKRVIVLGSPGGQLIPLENESISLIEVVAMAGGINEGGNAGKVRLIRGDLHEPEVFLVDLSTVKGMRESMLDIRPGDILYIEPHVRVVNEALRDIAVIASVVTSTIALILLIQTL